MVMTRQAGGRAGGASRGIRGGAGSPPPRKAQCEASRGMPRRASTPLRLRQADRALVFSARSAKAKPLQWPLSLSS
eukprot:3748159-Alexandrium_andersonii.AAC.1